MTVELGAFCLILALMLSLLQTGASAAGRIRGEAVLRGTGEGASLAAFLATKGGGAGARARPSAADGEAGGRRSAAEDPEARLFCFAMQSGPKVRGGK